MDDIQKLRELQAKGYCCAQVMVGMGLFLRDETNDQLMQAVGGLCGGVYAGLMCGALSGAACMLSLFDPTLAREEMIPELAEWFEDEYAAVYGSVNCDDILGGERSMRTQRCPMLMEETYLQARDILASHGFDVTNTD